MKTKFDPAGSDLLLASPNFARPFLTLLRFFLAVYKGRDCSEEFLMMHGTEVIDKYAPECVIGTLKQ